MHARARGAGPAWRPGAGPCMLLAAAAACVCCLLGGAAAACLCLPACFGCVVGAVAVACCAVHEWAEPLGPAWAEPRGGSLARRAGRRPECVGSRGALSSAPRSEPLGLPMARGSSLPASEALLRGHSARPARAVQQLAVDGRPACPGELARVGAQRSQSRLCGRRSRGGRLRPCTVGREAPRVHVHVHQCL